LERRNGCDVSGATIEEQRDRFSVSFQFMTGERWKVSASEQILAAENVGMAGVAEQHDTLRTAAEFRNRQRGRVGLVQRNTEHHTSRRLLPAVQTHFEGDRGS
jgi:hypothetical protein